MKSLLFTFILSLLVLSIGFAQSKGTPDERATKRSAKLTQLLSLSADQATRVKTAMVNKFTTIEKSKAAQPVDKQAIKGARTNYQAEMKSILSQEQYAKWEQMRKEAREKAKAKKNAKNKMSTEDAQDEAEDEI